MKNFLKKVFKKGVTKDYEVESLILNENTIDEIYDRYFKDPVKRKIDWCFNCEKIIYLLINGEKMDITDENKIFEKEKVVSLFKKDKFLDINLVYRDTFSKEKDIFVSDTIRDIFDKITKDYHNKYTYLYEHNDVPVYDYDFQKFYKIQDNKVFAKGGIKYDYLELNNKENFIFFIENCIKLKEKLEDKLKEKGIFFNRFNKEKKTLTLGTMYEDKGEMKKGLVKLSTLEKEEDYRFQATKNIYNWDNLWKELGTHKVKMIEKEKEIDINFQRKNNHQESKE